jgi:hypothetical protein
LRETGKLGFRRFAGTIPIGRARRKLARQLAGNVDRLRVGGNASGCYFISRYVQYFSPHIKHARNAWYPAEPGGLRWAADCVPELT